VITILTSVSNQILYSKVTVVANLDSIIGVVAVDELDFVFKVIAIVDSILEISSFNKQKGQFLS
jgi:hypothetical protein